MFRSITSLSRLLTTRTTSITSTSIPSRTQHLTNYNTRRYVSDLPQYPHLGQTKSSIAPINHKVLEEEAKEKNCPIRAKFEAEFAASVAEAELVRKQEWVDLTNNAAIQDHHDEHEHHEEQIIPIQFVDTDGTRFYITDARVGETVMDVAKRHNVQIPGFCNGGGDPIVEFGDGPMCTSCMVYIPTNKLETFPEADWKEKDLLSDDREGNFQSRLSCQLTLTAEHANLVIGLANYKNDPYIY